MDKLCEVCAYMSKAEYLALRLKYGADLEVVNDDDKKRLYVCIQIRYNLEEVIEALENHLKD